MGSTSSRPKHLKDISLREDNKKDVPKELLFAWLRRGEGMPKSRQSIYEWRSADSIVQLSRNKKDTQHLMEWYYSMASHEKEGRFRLYRDPDTSKLVVAF